MKKSFTLAEVLVTTVIVGILAMIVIPIMNSAKPDKDVILLKKALYSIQTAVADATEQILTEDSVNGWESDNASTTNSGFCSRVAEQLNTNEVNCLSEGSYENPQIITIDGSRYWGLPTTNFSSDSYNFAMERPLKGNEASTLCKIRKVGNTDFKGYDNNDCLGITLKVDVNGKVSANKTSNAGYYAYIDMLIKNGFSL